MKAIVFTTLLMGVLIGCARAAPPSVTPELINSLKVLNDPVVLIVPGKFDPSSSEQYVVASGIPGELVGKTSVFFFNTGRYDHHLTFPWAGGELLQPKSIGIFENQYVNLGTRHKLYYVYDFAGSGLDQIFMLQEGNGGMLSIYGYNGQTMGRLLSVEIDDAYAYPIQTVKPGVLKIFPKDDRVERINTTTFKLKYLIYTWDPKTWSYNQTHEGTQIGWWDRHRVKGQFPITYPIEEKPAGAE